MEFFNKKQDVIDLQLTNFGRSQLAKGKFNPVYYSFFDDNIAYDVLPSGIKELQNQSEERIKESQRLKVQYNFSSLEKQFNTIYEQNITKTPGSHPIDQQKTAEKKYALPQPIGTMSKDSIYSPSWSIRFLHGNLTGSQKDLRLKEHGGGEQVLNIPQIQSHTPVLIKKIQSNDELVDDLFDGPSESDVVLISNEEDYTILLKIIENNSEFQKKNFDIEFFEVIEDTKNDITVESLKPLYFEKPYQINDELDVFDQVVSEDDDNYVSHYFDISVDNEIPQSILCKYDPVNKKLGVFADERTQICQDILNQDQRISFNIYEDSAADNPGDIC
tara:strand:- start:218 stop:1210 length:993 start_codon:yes stop_codon:yes gene_type:complete